MPTGKNKVPMTPLRAALEQAGLRDVRTYIQSGNVIASTSLKQRELEQLVHDVIAGEFGGDIAVIARTLRQFQNILSKNPFKRADTTKLFFTLLSAKPKKRLVEEFLAPTYSPDKVGVIGDSVYIVAADQYAGLKANNNYIERKLEVSATTRVYRTMAKLLELSKEK